VVPNGVVRRRWPRHAPAGRGPVPVPPPGQSRTIPLPDYLAGDSEPFDLYYLSVDDGTRDRYDGWEVPFEVHQLLPDGTPVEAVVSGDRRYLYTIST